MKDEDLALSTRRAPAWKDAVLSRDEQFGLKRIALVKEAARAFSLRGYHDTTLEDVAKALGVTKGALYYYVMSKQEILFECHVISNDLGDQAIAYATALEGSGCDKAVALARRYMELLVGEAGMLAVLTEFDALEPQNRRIIAARRAIFDRTFREFMAQGVSDGSIRPGVDPKITAFFYLGAVNWATRWFDPAGDISGSEVSDRFADLFDAAIRLRS